MAFVSGRNRAAYRRQAEQSAALVTQMERLHAEQRRAAVLDERTRIAREIHDVLAHSLGALGIQLQAIHALTEQGDTGRALGLLGQAQRMAKDGLAETRRAVHALVPAPPDWTRSLLPWLIRTAAGITHGSASASAGSRGHCRRRRPSR